METDNGAAFAKLRESAEKYAELLRFFALLVCGTAMGLIFNALSGYEYSSSLLDRARHCFAPPFEGISGFFPVFLAVVQSAGRDIVYVMLLYLFGLTYICRQCCSVFLTLCGASVGVSAGVLATAASEKLIETAHPVACSVCFLLLSCLTALLYVLTSCFAERASVLFRGLSERSPNMVFTARFAVYCLACAASVGAVIIMRAVYLFAIHMLTL